MEKKKQREGKGGEKLMKGNRGETTILSESHQYQSTALSLPANCIQHVDVTQK